MTRTTRSLSLKSSRPYFLPSVASRFLNTGAASPTLIFRLYFPAPTGPTAKLVATSRARTERYMRFSLSSCTAIVGGVRLGRGVAFQGVVGYGGSKGTG